MNINELEELAKAVPGWSNCNKAWLDTSKDVSAAVVGHINEDGECYPVITVDCDQYYSGDSLNLAKFYAAANQSAILELIAAYREAVAALGEIYSINASEHGTRGMMIARCINVRLYRRHMGKVVWE